MARIRSVYPDICTDETMADISSRAERTFVRLWTHLDDAGRCVDNIKLIKAALYPLHDDMTAAEVCQDLLELEERGLVIRYEAQGVAVLAAKPEVWAVRQRPRHPKASSLPPAPSGKPAAKRRKRTADRGETSPVVVGVDVEVDVAMAPPQSAAAVNGREPDVLWEALISACDIAVEEITGSARGGYNAALKDIRAAGATPDEIHIRARLHRVKWRDASLTPFSLAKHWAELTPPKPVKTIPRPEYQETDTSYDPF